MTPDRIEQYEIVERLGAGISGTAYYARDTLLDRAVVIKLMHPTLELGDEAHTRMLEEARLASAIEHPNVCPIYEVGEHQGRPFIVMQYVRGKTLREFLDSGPLKIHFALSVGIQVANGLAAAHRLGILHRDMKPANIMITEDGVAKILDFGMARRKRAVPEDEDGEPTGDASSPADAGSVSERFGTRAYMAPEQFAIRRSSEQSDIFSLGVILYQMLTGRHPFLLATTDPRMVTAAIRTTQPTRLTILRPEVPEALEDVVLKALAKQPASRFRYAGDLADAMKAVMRSLQLETGVVPGEISAVLPSPGPEGQDRQRGLLAGLVERFLPATPEAPSPNSIAVLPFQDLEEPEGSRLYGFTLSNAVATRLSGVRNLVVRPLSAYLSVSDRLLDPAEAGRQLRTERALLGSFTRTDGRFVLHWQLLDVASRSIVAGGTVKADSTRLAVVQDQVADDIFRVLHTSGELRPAESDPSRARTALGELTDEAREQYLAARALLAGFAVRAGSREDLEQARAAYERVVEAAPSFASGHAGLGTVYLRSARNGFGGVGDLRAAERHLTRAVELDPDLVEAKLYRASTLIWAGEKDRARLDLQYLLKETPPDADVYLAAGVILQLDGLLDEALRVQSAALHLTPSVAPRAYYYRARVFLFQGKMEAARQEVDKGLALQPEHRQLRHVLGFHHLLSGQLDAAIEVLEDVLAGHPHFRILAPTLAMAYVRVGRREDAVALITDALLDAAAADAETAYRVATYYAVVEDAEQALAWLRRAVYLGNENYPWFARNPTWTLLQDDAELRVILSELEEVHRMNRTRWEAVLAAI